MKVIVCAPQAAMDELKETCSNIEACKKEESLTIEADVLLYLYEDGLSQHFNCKQVIINEVVETINRKGICRINGWPGFLRRDTWEISGNVTEHVHSALQQLGKKTIVCKDEPGLIAARVLAMIINEGCYAMEENISSIEDIDKAMKLGTGYPYGPFEWLTIIGKNRILSLLNKLCESDERYEPSDLLKLDLP